MLYIKVFVNIVLSKTITTVYIELVSKKGVTAKHEKEFETLVVESKMLDFINEYTRETPYFYISILSPSSLQGAIPTCSSSRISFYEDLSDSEYKCYNSQWIFHTSKADLYEIEKKYKECGIDFVFSPFSIVSYFFRDKIDTPLAMYILLQDTSVSVSIFHQSELVYAKHIDVDSHEESNELLVDMTEDINMESDVDIDDLDISEEIDALDDFGDIEDLDELEDIEEFSESEDVEEEFHNEESEEEMQESVNGDDYKYFLLIQSSINTFYADAKFESDFLENIYIADGVGVTSEFKHYFEEEMYMNAYVRHISIPEEVSKLAKLEVLK